MAPPDGRTRLIQRFRISWEQQIVMMRSTSWVGRATNLSETLPCRELLAPRDQARMEFGG